MARSTEYTRSARRISISSTQQIRRGFHFFFYTLQSYPAVVLYVYLLPKSAIPDVRARNPSSFFSALAVETLLPASGNRSNYSYDFFVDTPRSSRYIAYLRHATIFVFAEQVLLLCGGHQKVIHGTELLLNNRPAESEALRFEIVGLDICRVL
jgi:hypothetical protein